MRDVGRAWNPGLADSADGNRDAVCAESIFTHFLRGVPHARLFVVAGFSDRFDRASRDALAAGAVGIE